MLRDMLSIISTRLSAHDYLITIRCSRLRAGDHACTRNTVSSTERNTAIFPSKAICPQNSVLFKRKRKTAFCVGKSFNFTGTKLPLLFGGCCLLFGPNCSTSPHQMLSILPWMQVPSKPIFGLHHSHIWRMKTKSCGANLY